MAEHLGSELGDQPERMPSPANEQAVWANLEPTYRKFAPRMHSYLRSMGADLSSAEDNVNEAFIKLYKRMLNGPPIEDVLPYLIKTVHNCWISWLRQPGQAECSPYAGILDDHVDPESEERFERIIELDSQELRIEALRQAITQLPPREREVVILREMSGLSTAQVAETLSIREVTVRVHLSTGKRRLARLLKIRDNDEEGDRR